MCFHFCVLPCFPWLLPVLTIGRRAKRSNVSRTEITEGREMIQEDIKIDGTTAAIVTEKRNTTEKNEINVRQLTEGIKRFQI